MRVLVYADMEGIAQIKDHRECWPVWPEYWRDGRRKLTASTLAAVEGLKEGGASHVTVLDGHGFDWPNIVRESLPPGTRITRRMPPRGSLHGVFMIGRHARCGTRGFVSHTNVPDFRVAVDGSLVTECHLGAWAAGVPVLGIVGDEALGPELDGPLSGTPFLAVKRAVNRHEAVPVHRDQDASSAAVRAFARDCARTWRDRPRPRLPRRFTVDVSLDPAAADRVDGRRGWVRVSPAVVRLIASGWRRQVSPALYAATEAGAAPLWETLTGIDVSSEQAVSHQPSEALERARHALTDFVETDYAAWRTD